MNTICPICKEDCINLHSLSFSEKAYLPNMINILVCSICEFAFSTPRDAANYKEYYASNLNDHLGADIRLTEAEKRRYEDQMSLLSQFLSKSPGQRVLDVGCGQAGLLRTMREHYPSHTYVAVDPNVGPTQFADPEICFADDWKKLVGNFDLIILSHVIEHIVDFDDFAQLSKLLTETGVMYIEVPDASQYCNYLRREHLYYFDRLHINHFTVRALSLLVEQWGLHVFSSDQNEFEYKDGHPFPATYVMAARQLPAANAGPPLLKLLNKLHSYVYSEYGRASVVQQKLAECRSVVVYGFGDNFFKSVAIGGPLEGIPISAIIDKRHSSLSQTHYAESYQFLSIDACCSGFPDATYVVTVSWGDHEIRKTLQDRGIQKILLI